MWYYSWYERLVYIATDFPDLFGRVESEFNESVGSNFARVSQAAANSRQRGFRNSKQNESDTFYNKSVQ